MGSISIRDETPRDEDDVRAVHALAFPDETVTRLVDDLRQSGDVVISLVAEHETEIVGHVMFSRIGAPMRALTLSPLGVRPAFQKAGIGSALVRNGLERVRQENWQAVFLLGSPAYYGRFGFSSTAAQGYTAPYWGWPFQVRIFDNSAPRTGKITFPAAFDEDIKQFPALLNSLKPP